MQGRTRPSKARVTGGLTHRGRDERWPMQGWRSTRSTRTSRSDRGARQDEGAAPVSSSRRQNPPSTASTMSEPRTERPCRRRNVALPKRCLTSGGTRVVLSPRVSSKACVPCRAENREPHETVWRGCGQHTQVVELTRIYAWIIPSRNSAYKERARLQKATFPK